jgi:hypothetical protein
MIASPELEAHSQARRFRFGLSRYVGAAIICLVLFVVIGLSQVTNVWSGRSYALVVGINKYTADPKWQPLTYAVKDARAVAAYLRSQNFEVIELYDEKATREAIGSAIEDQLVPKLGKDDRVMFFFAGHGDTRTLANEERGYLVPYGGTRAYGSLLPVTTLRDWSAAMKAAKHQLFVLDSCFGGLAATRGGTETIDPRIPNFIFEISRRQARQLLTAGGASQRVQDVGPNGHSLFAGQLLRALEEGIADKNGDTYVTFSELVGYMQPAASNFNQTPGHHVYDGHEQGEFWFTTRARPAASPSSVDRTLETRSAPVDVYRPLIEGKQLFIDKQYARARPLLRQAAELGNAEAMSLLAVLLWEGNFGTVAKEEKLALEWFVKAAERGDTIAMTNLVRIYRSAPYLDAAAATRWERQMFEVSKLQALVTVIVPSGQAGRADPSIPTGQTTVTVQPPSNLRLIP